MTQEDKELLLKDLCGRLPYGVKVQWVTETTELIGIIEDIAQVGYDINDYDVAAIEDIKPYLRPMSSMTEEEENEWMKLGFKVLKKGVSSIIEYDWLNDHHFDYRGLIEKRLAIEAPEGMYKED